MTPISSPSRDPEAILTSMPIPAAAAATAPIKVTTAASDDAFGAKGCEEGTQTK